MNFINNRANDILKWIIKFNAINQMFILAFHIMIIIAHIKKIHLE